MMFRFLSVFLMVSLIILSPAVLTAQDESDEEVADIAAADAELSEDPKDLPFRVAPEPVPIVMKQLPGGEVNYLGQVKVKVEAFSLAVHEFTNRQACELLNWAMMERKIDPQLFNKSFLEYKGIPYIRIDTPDSALHIPGAALLDVKWLEDNQPLVYITPFGAMLLCNLLSEKEGLTPVYDLDAVTWNESADGYRLPTSAELGWAIRYREEGMLPANRIPGGRDYNDHSWHLGNRFTTGRSTVGNLGSHMVGTRKVNELGLFDLSGNVSEICWDRYRYAWYPEADAVNPQGPEIPENELDTRYNIRLVTRGGSWNLPAKRLVSGAHGNVLLDKFSEGIGFRLARGAR